MEGNESFTKGCFPQITDLSREKVINKKKGELGSNYSMILVISSGNQLRTLVASPRFNGRNWNVLASPCMFNSSSACNCRDPYAASSSSVLRVEEDPFAATLFAASSIATRNIVDAEERIEGLDDVVKMSWILSCSPS